MKIIFIILVVVSLGVILWIIGRHLKELRILNIDVLPEEREKKIKENLLAERFKRQWNEKIKILKTKFNPFFSVTKKIQDKLKNRIIELEKTYDQAKQLKIGTRGKRTAQILSLIREAEELWREGKTEEAEKKYISVISIDERNIDAYEGLGNLYLEMKKYDEAKESLSFILKFRPNDASVITSLGEVALAMGNTEEAFDYFKRSAELRPGNPKYLDFYIETAIILGRRDDARLGVQMMKDTNPENQKIPEWENKIENL